MLSLVQPATPRLLPALLQGAVKAAPVYILASSYSVYAAPRTFVITPASHRYGRRPPLYKRGTPARTMQTMSIEAPDNALRHSARISEKDGRYSIIEEITHNRIGKLDSATRPTLLTYDMWGGDGQRPAVPTSENTRMSGDTLCENCRDSVNAQQAIPASRKPAAASASKSGRDHYIRQQPKEGSSDDPPVILIVFFVLGGFLLIVVFLGLVAFPCMDFIFNLGEGLTKSGRERLSSERKRTFEEGFLQTLQNDSYSIRGALDKQLRRGLGEYSNQKAIDEQVDKSIGEANRRHK